jgi:hypothetical protein
MGKPETKGAVSGRGGRRSTTWKKGENPVKKKGTKHTRTKIKEAIGLQNWEGLKKYIEESGSAKLMQEMNKLTGKDFVTAYSSLLEFVKPKLARVESKIEGELDINLGEVPIVFK